jgi:hypothetical protein
MGLLLDICADKNAAIKLIEVFGVNTLALLKQQFRFFNWFRV